MLSFLLAILIQAAGGNAVDITGGPAGGPTAHPTVQTAITLGPAG